MKEAAREIPAAGVPDYGELWRPQYHFSTLDSRINDPNGLVYYKGVYHLYYQSLPHGQNVGKHWGHAESTDLIHWKELGCALFPDDLGHMWSGTAAVDHGNTSGFFSDTPDKTGIIAAYSTHTQHVGIAYSKDGGRTFTKVSTSEPVIKNPGIGAFRDPHLFRHPESGMWKIAVAGKSGALWIYESADLLHWELCSMNRSVNTECPNLFRMQVQGSGEEKWILSCVGRDYYVGSFDGREFIPETGRISMNEGPDAYAGITFSDMPDGRTVMISWMNAFHPTPDGKWNGCFTVPVEMKLIRTDTSLRLVQNPVAELASVKGKTVISLQDKTFGRGIHPLEGVRTNRFDLTAEIDLEKSDSFAIGVLEGPGEETVIAFDKTTGCLSADRHKSLCGPAETTDRNARFSFRPDPFSLRNGKLKLRILADVSALELFVNDGFDYFVMRIHPLPEAQNMSLRCEGTLSLLSLTAEECGSIWFDGEIPPVCPSDLPRRADPVPEICDAVDREVPFVISAHAVREGEDRIFLHKYGSGVASEIQNGVGDFTLSADVTVRGEGAARILFRMTDTENFYCLTADVCTGRISLQKKKNGIPAELCSAACPTEIGVPQAFRITAAGARMTVTRNGETVLQAEDADFQAGKIALCVHRADAVFDRLHTELR